MSDYFGGTSSTSRWTHDPQAAFEISDRMNRMALAARSLEILLILSKNPPRWL